MHLRRMQGRSRRPHPGYPADHPRAHRLRLLQLVDQAQPDPGRGRVRRQFHALQPVHRPRGQRHRIRRRKEAAAGREGGLRHLQAQGHSDLLDLSGRAHRRRRPCRGPRHDRGARHHRLRDVLRRLQGSLAVGGTPYREQRGVHSRRRQEPGEARGRIQGEHARRVQHRRRRLRARAAAGASSA